MLLRFLPWFIVGVMMHAAIAEDFQYHHSAFRSILLAENTDREPVWLPNTMLSGNAPSEGSFEIPKDRTRDNLLDGIEAFLKKQSSTLEQLAAIEEHPRARELLEYWDYSIRLPKMAAQEIMGTLGHFTSPVLSQRYRANALLRAGKIEAWSIVEQLYPTLLRPGREQQCYAVLADLASGSTALLTSIGFEQWETNTKPRQACYQVNREIMRRRLKDKADIASRVRLMLYTNAKRDFLSLPSNAMFSLPSKFSKKLFLKSPKTLLANALKAKKGWRAGEKTARYRLWMLAVIARLSRKSPELAANAYEAFLPYLSNADQKIAKTYIGLSFALELSMDAVAWLQGTGQIPYLELWPKYQLTIIRTYLRASEWGKVKAAIEQLSPILQSKITWRYWWARSLIEMTSKSPITQENIRDWLAVDIRQPEHQNHALAFAAQTMKAISRENDFYGALAAEWLGQSLYIPPFTRVSTAEEMAEVQRNRCLKWAAFLIHLGDRTIRRQGVSEWRACVKGMNDRQLLAASRLAFSLQIFDRAINTAILTKHEHDWRLRFLTPFQGLVQRYAIQRALSVEWIYGLIRQESRFIINVASSAGAQGLMQIMPKTGRWLAKKLGIELFSTFMLNDMDTNIRLGTYYMERLFDRFDHPVLVSAAYNAGPRRAQRWRPDDTHMEAAIYAESIPFKETRGYVKSVLWNSTVYQILHGKKPQATISHWLPVVTSAQTATRDLP